MFHSHMCCFFLFTNWCQIRGQLLFGSGGWALSPLDMLERFIDCGRFGRWSQSNAASASVVTGWVFLSEKFDLLAKEA